MLKITSILTVILPNDSATRRHVFKQHSQPCGPSVCPSSKLSPCAQLVKLCLPTHGGLVHLASYPHKISELPGVQTHTFSVEQPAGSWDTKGIVHGPTCLHIILNATWILTVHWRWPCESPQGIADCTCWCLYTVPTCLSYNIQGVPSVTQKIIMCCTKEKRSVLWLFHDKSKEFCPHETSCRYGLQHQSVRPFRKRCTKWTCTQWRWWCTQSINDITSVNWIESPESFTHQPLLQEPSIHWDLA